MFEGKIDMHPALEANTLFNYYSLENIVLGLMQPNEKIPFDKFVKELELENIMPKIDRKVICGRFVDKDEKIVNLDKETMMLHFYILNIRVMFKKIMLREYDDENRKTAIPCEEHFHNYFIKIFDLFCEVVATEVEYDYYDLVPNIRNTDKRMQNILLVQKFIADILITEMQQGKNVDKYIKKFQDIPFAIEKIIDEKDGKYILSKGADSLEYKLALFSSFSFANIKHTKIMELKIKRWYEVNARNISEN